MVILIQVWKAKLLPICPFFFRLEAVFGFRPDIIPPTLSGSGVSQSVLQSATTELVGCLGRPEIGEDFALPIATARASPSAPPPSSETSRRGREKSLSSIARGRKRARPQALGLIGDDERDNSPAGDGASKGAGGGRQKRLARDDDRRCDRCHGCNAVCPERETICSY